MVILLEINELRKLSSEELNKKIITSKEELFTRRMQQASGTLEHPSELNKLRKDVARMKTILKEREIAGGNE
jgi:large subunit ribosomal protein L29